MSKTIRYREEILIGYCYMCNAAHSRDEVTPVSEGGKTHCPHCKQKLPEEQRLSPQRIWVCNRTGADLFDHHLFIPPIKTEVPIDEEEPEVLPRTDIIRHLIKEQAS